MPCVACGKPLATQASGYSPTSSLEIAAFQTPHIKRATICLWIAAALLALSSVRVGVRISDYEEDVAAFRRVIVQSEKSDTFALGIDLARDDLREAEAEISGAKATLALQIALTIVLMIAALSLKRSPRQASLLAAFAFGAWVLLVLIVAPGELLLPEEFLAVSLMAIVLYFAVVAGKKIHQANEHFL